MKKFVQNIKRLPKNSCVSKTKDNMNSPAESIDFTIIPDLEARIHCIKNLEESIKDPLNLNKERARERYLTEIRFLWARLRHLWFSSSTKGGIEVNIPETLDDLRHFHAIKKMIVRKGILWTCFIDRAFYTEDSVNRDLFEASRLMRCVGEDMLELLSSQTFPLFQRRKTRA